MFKNKNAMQITRETIQLQTPFIFISDKCPCCGSKAEFDTFALSIGFQIECDIPDEEGQELAEIAEQFQNTVAPYAKEAAEIFEKKNKGELSGEKLKSANDRIKELEKDISECGGKLIKSHYELRVDYRRKGNGKLTGGAYCQLYYTEVEASDLDAAVLFQADINTIEELISIYNIVSRGFSLGQLELIPVDIGETAPCDYYEKC